VKKGKEKKSGGSKKQQTADSSKKPVEARGEDTFRFVEERESTGD